MSQFQIICAFVSTYFLLPLFNLIVGCVTFILKILEKVLTIIGKVLKCTNLY